MRKWRISLKITHSWSAASGLGSHVSWYLEWYFLVHYFSWLLDCIDTIWTQFQLPSITIHNHWSLSLTKSLNQILNLRKYWLEEWIDNWFKRIYSINLKLYQKYIQASKYIKIYIPHTVCVPMNHFKFNWITTGLKVKKITLNHSSQKYISMDWKKSVKTFPRKTLSLYHRL